MSFENYPLRYPLRYIEPSSSPPELRLGICKRCRTMSLRCVTSVGGRQIYPSICFGTSSALEVIKSLVKARIEDIRQGNPPEHFRFVRQVELARACGVDAQALRRRAERLRDSLCKAIAVNWPNVFPCRELVLETEHASGYRLAPKLRIERVSSSNRACSCKTVS